ncbi:MAG TPA: TAXI family TRAP transporter solute-binding subunit, partial [Anaerovoracaceae bacterium]|nr:TAXI family TRAP transporter solute-binding subunit [Anaerovoracaceae bacterium]
LTAVLLLFAACGGSAPSEGDASGTPAETPAAPAKITSYSLGTAGTTGAQYIIGAGIANAINKYSSTINVAVQSTEGGAAALVMTDAGEMDFGFGNTDTCYNYYYGTGFVAPEDKTEHVVGVMALQPSFGQMLARKDSGIETYADLKGKKVCLGTTSPTTYSQSRAILKAYGIDPDKDLGKTFIQTQDEGTQMLADGDIDATFIVAAVPTAAYENLMVTGDYVLVNADPEILQKAIDAEMPYAKLGVIEAGTYEGQDKAITALFCKSNIFTRDSVPDEVVYEFVKQVYDNWDEIKLSHAILPTLDPASFYDVGFPLHPGAEKYYKEKGYIK